MIIEINEMNMKPIAFHPYPSHVIDRIFKTEYNSRDQIHQLENYLIDLFNQEGIKSPSGYKVQYDNKIVFEFELKGIKIYFGFYDWNFAIGLGYQTQKW